MQVRFGIAAFLCFLAGGCASVKYNSHIGSDGSTGYLRTYYASSKARGSALSDGTGIEYCKVQGSDVICKDLNVILSMDNARRDEGQPVPVGYSSEAVPTAAPQVKAPGSAAKKDTAKKGPPKK